MYLVDTNVLSASDPVALRSGEHGRVVDWLRRHRDHVFISSITVAEIEAGIARAKRRGATQKAAEIEDWWRNTIIAHERRILAFDMESATIAGRLYDAAIGRGHDPGFEDAAIAGIALRHGLQVVTRNTRHFKTLDVTFINPYESAP